MAHRPEQPRATWRRARREALAFVAGQVHGGRADGTDRPGGTTSEMMADKIWPGTRALARRHPGRRGAGVAGHGDARASWRPRRSPSRLGLTGALGTVAEHGGRGATPGGWSATADARHRPRPRRCGRAERAATGLDLQPVRGVFSDSASTTCRCCRWSARPSRSTPTPRCVTWRASGVGRSVISAPPARPPASGCRRPWRSGRWVARWPPSSPGGSPSNGNTPAWLATMSAAPSMGRFSMPLTSTRNHELKKTLSKGKNTELLRC